MASKQISSEDGFVSLNVRASVLQKMLNGEELEECERCYKIEKHGGSSPRQTYNKRYPLESLFPGRERLLDVKLSIFGNYCNLSCAMCQPVHSSERTKEIASLVKDPYFNINPREDIKWDWRQGHKKYQHNYARFKELMQNSIFPTSPNLMIFGFYCFFHSTHYIVIWYTRCQF